MEYYASSFKVHAEDNLTYTLFVITCKNCKIQNSALSTYQSEQRQKYAQNDPNERIQEL